ncbi:MAG: PIG-L family deacetylase, partial [Candidatus Bathyarchaeota archaeon]
KIVLLAYGDSKSGSIKEALEGPITNLVPASILQKHPNLTVIVDKGAGSKLNAFSNPWLVRQINWKKEQAKLESKNDNFIENAVIWLSKKTQKTISNLKVEDYKNNNLTDLAELYPNKIGSINQEINNRLNSKILTKTQLPFNKKILILSPHPDDDVISVGATIKYLQENGNSLKIIYMVSGNIAVRNEDVIKYLNKKQKSKNTDQQLDLKSENFDLEKIFELKSKVRENEAKRATITLGLSENSLIFLESPFYETGQIIKNEIQESDWQPLVKILENEKPDIIMVPGESTDPHGTHGKCIKIFRIAFKKSKIKNLEIWNYRGGWEEYSVSEADRIVTFSEKIMNKKIEAIKQHRSQLDPVFGGLDTRPFWKRAKDRNRYSGKILRSIGVSTTKYAELFKTEKQ